MRQKDDFSCAPVAIRNWIKKSSFSKLPKNLLEDISFLLDTDEDGTDPDCYMSLIRVIAAMCEDKVTTYDSWNLTKTYELRWGSGIFLEYVDSTDDEHIAYADFDFEKQHWNVYNSQIIVNDRMKQKFTTDEINSLILETDGRIHGVK